MLNPVAQDTYRKLSRIGPTPPLSALAQMGRYRSIGVAPNVVSQGMRNQQASHINPMLGRLAPLNAAWGGDSRLPRPTPPPPSPIASPGLAGMNPLVWLALYGGLPHG